MKKLILLLCLFSTSALANWQVEVALGVDGQTWKIDNTILKDGKQSQLILGNYVIKMTIKKSKEEKGLDVSYLIHEKKGEKLILISMGEDIIEIGRPMNEIYAKGRPKQPNTIITLKLKNI